LIQLNDEIPLLFLLLLLLLDVHGLLDGAAGVGGDGPALGGGREGVVPVVGGVVVGVHLQPAFTPALHFTRNKIKKVDNLVILSIGAVKIRAFVLHKIKMPLIVHLCSKFLCIAL
jgi:hypothetical protein